MAPVEALCRDIARQAHEGQIDKAGKPYILHPQYVADHVGTPTLKAIAWLHDVVEDTPLTLDDLRGAGVPERVVTAVDALTRRPGDDYMAYVSRAGSDDLARQVKLADLAHNMDTSRLARVTERDRKRLARYRAARDILMGEPSANV